MSNKILKNYVSEVDLFLQKFDRTHPVPSASQQKEIDKYKQIYFLRDVEDRPSDPSILWEKF